MICKDFLSSEIELCHICSRPEIDVTTTLKDASGKDFILLGSPEHDGSSNSINSIIFISQCRLEYYKDVITNLINQNYIEDVFNYVLNKAFLRAHSEFALNYYFPELSDKYKTYKLLK